MHRGYTVARGISRDSLNSSQDKDADMCIGTAGLLGLSRGMARSIVNKRCADMWREDYELLWLSRGTAFSIV